MISNAVTASPSQKPRNPFPAWYLRCGVMNATDNTIDQASAACERWEWHCAAAVVLAVVGEIALAIIHPSYDSPWNRWGTSLADIVIALGIVGEVLFGRLDGRYQTELRKRSNDKLGKANKLAAEAHERAAEVERLTGFRRISHDQLQRIRAALSEFIGAMDLLIEFQNGDTEAYIYARDLVTTFWGVAKIRSGPNSYPMYPMFGIFVETTSPAHMEAISNGFVEAGIQFSRLHKDLSTHFPRDALAPNAYIFVGLKPPPPLVSPAIAPKQNTQSMEIT